MCDRTAGLRTRLCASCNRCSQGLCIDLSHPPCAPPQRPACFSVQELLLVEIYA
jgi:hypothetical protein